MHAVVETQKVKRNQGGGGGLNFANFYNSGGIPKMVADRSLDVVLLRDL